MHRTVLSWGILALLASAAACSDDPPPSVAPTTTAATTSGTGGAGGAGGGSGGTPCLSGTGGGTVRVATWNVEVLGEPGSAEHEAAKAVLERVGADVVGFNEINGSAEVGHFETLASDLGYGVTLAPTDVSPFGTQRNALMTTMPVTDATLHSAATLSADPLANDITRLIPSMTVDVNGCPLTVVVHHWKSGFNRENVFRRAVESIRVGQVVADLDGTTDPFMFMGDVNEEVDGIPVTPVPFFDVPMDLPPDFVVGSDIAARLASDDGIDNNAFTHLWNAPPGVTEVDAEQLDGDLATRPDSSRRLDYVFVSAALGNPVGEVYDSADEALGGGLPKSGRAPDPGASAAASDHLLVFVDVDVPGCACVP